MTALPEAYFAADVIEVRDLSSVMRRIVLGGDGLADYRSSGAPDEWFRLMVPPERQQQVELPHKEGQQFHFANPQPLPRWYSLRRWDAERRRVTVDVVVHDHGVATRWAQTVQPGDQLLISQPHGRGIDAQADWVLILADQTGIPAACRILENLAPRPARARGVRGAERGRDVHADLAGRAEGVLGLQPVAGQHPQSAERRRPDDRAAAGSGLRVDGGRGGCARDVRRYFRHELKWRSQHYDIVGYWRPDQEAYQRRYREIEPQVSRVVRGRSACRAPTTRRSSTRCSR